MDFGASLGFLASEFFQVFSRMEYAFKATGFHFGDGDARANWTKFAKQIEHQFVNPTDDDLRQAIKFILGDPPKKQKIVDGVLAWEACPINSNSQAEKLLLYVCRVRNNLFHGASSATNGSNLDAAKPS